VADEKGRLHAGIAHGTGRRDDVLHAAAESAVSEVATALTQPGEVEAQHADALAGERAPDANRGKRVLGAGEAMSKQRVVMRWPVGKVELADQTRSLLAFEFEQFVAHHVTPDRVKRISERCCPAHLAGLPYI